MRSIQCQSEEDWVCGVLKDDAIRCDKEGSICFSKIEVEGTHLCLEWVNIQMPFSIVLSKTCQSLADRFPKLLKWPTLSCYAQVVSIDKALGVKSFSLVI